MASVWREIEAMEPPLTAPERHLIAACKAGQPCVLGIRHPEGPDPDRTIRADLLRYLILGGCEDCRVDEGGVELVGAYISKRLNLSYKELGGRARFRLCRFENEIVAQRTVFRSLDLSGSTLPGLIANGATIAGDLFLNDSHIMGQGVVLVGAKVDGSITCHSSLFVADNRESSALNAQEARIDGSVTLGARFRAVGDIILAGATIAGGLECSHCDFASTGAHAINADGVEIRGSVSFRDKCKAAGEVTFAGAKIGGQFSINSAAFRNANGDALNCQGLSVDEDVLLGPNFSARGEVRFVGAKVRGSMSCENAGFENASGKAFNAQRMQVAGSFLWRSVSVKAGSVLFAAAHVGDLADDLDSWPKGEGRLLLDGFTYERISAAFIDVQRRLQWLARGTNWKGEFFPQPYTHLAKVLREMGHDRAAREVLVERGRRTSEHEWRRAHAALNGNWQPAFRSVAADLGRFARLVSRGVVGYGYKPFRSLWSLGGLWAIAWVLASMSWLEGSMVPNSAVILNSEEWRTVERETLAARLWSDPGQPGQDWETFQPIRWGFDVVVPIISIGQTDAWAPSPARGGWGWMAWWGRWILSVMGWIVAALAAAAVTGIIRREGD